jgi:uncharacterized membrane protein
MVKTMSGEPPFKAKRAMLIFFAAWLAVVLAAPMLLPSGSVPDLSGRAGYVDNSAVIDTMNPFSAAVYLIGDGNCHQLSQRSFYLNGNQMPFCARDVGIFIGLAAGMLAVLLLSPRFSWLVLVLLALPILIDGGVLYAGGYESTNLVRLITGMLGGVAASYFLGHVADRSLTIKRSGASSEEKE